MAKNEQALMSKATKRNKQKTEDLEKEIAEMEALARGETPTEDEPTTEENTPVDEAPKEEKPTENEPTDPEEKSFKKRYGDLRSHSAKEKKELQDRISALEEQLEAKPSGELPSSEEDLEAWREQYPDVSKVIESLIQKRATEIVADQEEKTRTQLDEIRKGQSELTREKAEAKIKKAHPDFEKLQEDDKFHDWVDEQPKWVQDGLFLNSDDPDSVIRILDFYKSDTGQTPAAKKEKEKEAAKGVDTKSKTSIDPEENAKKFRESDIRRMSADEYEEKEELIMEAMRTGNFIYDISGAAR